MNAADRLDRDRAQVTHAVRQAANNWADAMRSHKMAPPDAGFSSRLRALADAAASEQNAWHTAHSAGLQWEPIAGARNAQPPYELRPGTGRRGPAELWERFDTAVAQLNQAITGTDAAAVATAFGQLSHAAGELADALAREDAAAGALARTRAQGAA